jgi:hypothetical protein
MTVCRIVALGLVIGLATAAAPAAITNGSFETGNFSGWTVFTTAGGTANVVTVYNPWVAQQGTYFALLKKNGPGQANGIQQLLNLSAGDQIKFYYFFDTANGITNDRAFATLTNGVDQLLLALAGPPDRTQPEGTWLQVVSNPVTAGQYLLKFWVEAEGTCTAPTYLGVDNVQICAGIAPTPPVPEPITMAALLMGAGGVGAYIRRRLA